MDSIMSIKQYAIENQELLTVQYIFNQTRVCYNNCIDHLLPAAENTVIENTVIKERSQV